MRDVAGGVAISLSGASQSKTILLERGLAAGNHPQPASRDLD